MRGKGALSFVAFLSFILGFLTTTAPAANQWLPKGPPGADAEALAVDPKNPNIMYMGTISHNGIFRTIDGGQHWTHVTAGIKDVQTFDIAVSPANSKIVLAACFGRTGAQSGLYRSTDGGNHWVQKIKSGILCRSVLFMPKTPALVFVGTNGSGVYKSTDSGNTWKFAEGPGQPMFITRAMVADSNGAIYMGVSSLNASLRGVWRSIDGAITWTRMGAATLTADIRTLAIDPNNNQILYAGIYNGFVYKSIDGGNTWAPLSNGHTNDQDTLSILVDPYDSQIVYACGWPYGAFKSTNGGANFSPFNDELPVLSVPAIRSTPKTSNPANQILFAGTFSGVYKRTASATTWTALNNGLHNYQVNGLVSWPTNNIVAALGWAGTARTTDAGANWTFVPPNPSNRYSYEATRIVYDSTDNIMYLGTNGAGVYKSTDYGQSFFAVNTGLGTSGLIIDSLLLSDQALYAGTYNMGIYKSDRDGTSWTQINNGLPGYPTGSPTPTSFVGVESIASDNSPTETLYIGCADRNNPQEDNDCRMFKSTNGGTIWFELRPGGIDIKAIYKSIAVDNLDHTIIYATGDNPLVTNGGIYLKLGDYGDTILGGIWGEGAGNDVGTYGYNGVYLGMHGTGSWDSWDRGLSFYSIFPSTLPNPYVKCTAGGYDGSGGGLLIGTDGGGTFTIELTKGLVLYGPNGGNPNPGDSLGTVYFKGNSKKITWDYWGFGGNVTLELYQNGKKKGTIATRNVDDCEYDWIVGKTTAGWAPLGSGYRVNIKNSDGSCVDASDMTFSIEMPSIIVTSPKGGEKWLRGSRQDITWTPYLESAGNVIIELVSGTKTLGAIATVPATPATYSWIVGSYGGSTAPLGATYKIRVKTQAGALSGLSKSNFSIIGIIALAFPNGGEQWAQNSNQNISWNSGGLTGAATLELWKGATKLGVIATAPDVTSGTYSWTVGSYGAGKLAPKGTGYKVKIICSGISDTSNGPFTIN